MDMCMKSMMRMQKIVVIGLGLILLLVSSTTVAEEEVNLEPNPNEGRFKIFIAEHDAIFKGKHIIMKSIFKMDRETGTVWRYRQGVDSKGKPFEEFFEVPNQ